MMNENAKRRTDVEKSGRMKLKGWKVIRVEKVTGLGNSEIMRKG